MADVFEKIEGAGFEPAPGDEFIELHTDKTFDVSFSIHGTAPDLFVVVYAETDKDFKLTEFDVDINDASKHTRKKLNTVDELIAYAKEHLEP